MSESLHLTLGGNEFEATPYNTTLFTFLGRTAIHGMEVENYRYNHIFFQTGEEDENTISGTYMFRDENNSDKWDIISSHIVNEDFPMVLNRRDVPDCDRDAYRKYVEQTAANEINNLGDFVPEGWE